MSEVISCLCWIWFQWCLDFAMVYVFFMLFILLLLLLKQGKIADKIMNEQKIFLGIFILSNIATIGHMTCIGGLPGLYAYLIAASSILFIFTVHKIIKHIKKNQAEE